MKKLYKVTFKSLITNDEDLKDEVLIVFSEKSAEEVAWQCEAIMDSGMFRDVKVEEYNVLVEEGLRGGD